MGKENWLETRYFGESWKNTSGSGGSTITTAGSLNVYDPWSEPIRIKVNEVGESIEFIYKQTSLVTYTIYPPNSPQERVFKIIYSCIDGKWNKSERIYGEIIPASNEYYEFENLTEYY